ncbi:hypothetical protein Golax_012872 [Gossypium laxum]|uniref:Uncharacterized protein n=5 Tax=Gossypium TaxID=3633 RepID=A0A7J8ZRD0_9ROSI|nr:hypothetical protein [Gossypium laxum]
MISDSDVMMDSLSKFMRSRTSFSLLEGKMLAR